MIRTCPKCGAHYADQLLAFCLTDGMPLISLDPGNERWTEASRVIEEKTRAARKQHRRSMWWRVAAAALTTMMLAMVISKSYVVETIPIGTIPPFTETPPSSDSPVPDGPLLALLPSSSPSPSTSPSPSPSPSPAASITPVYKISGRVTDAGQPLGGVKVRLEGSKATITTTDGNGYYAFTDLSAGRSYKLTPVQAKTNFTPSGRSFNNLTKDGIADFTAVVERESKPAPECTEEDKGRERRNIRADNEARWLSSIRDERPKILADKVRDGEIAEATTSQIDVRITFLEVCNVAHITVSYEWRINVFANGSQVREVKVPGQRKYICGKAFGGWFCKSI